jgi:hypothetical protein
MNTGHAADIVAPPPLTLHCRLERQHLLPELCRKIAALAPAPPTGALDQKAEVFGWVIHDCRRTLRSKCAELKILREVAEHYIGHIQPGVEGIYDRYSYLAEMCQAVELWEHHLIWSFVTAS